MTKQLTFENLAPYLPSDPIAYGASDLWHITGATKKKIIMRNGAHKQAISYEDFTCDYSLLLYSNAALTKEITHKGETFCPIVVIGKKLGFNLEPYDLVGETRYGWDEQLMDDVQGYEFTFDEKLKTFGVYYDCKEDNSSPIYTYGGYDEIKMLLSWHFDLEGLIDAGIAIDVETINENPYK